jgi:hypothetical protein
MNSEAAKHNLAEYAARLAKRLEAVRKIQVILEEHPEVADDLGKLFADQPSQQVGDTRETPEPRQPSTGEREAVPNGREQEPTLYQRMRDLLQSRNNKPISIPEMAAALGVNRGGISNAVYVGHADDFESLPVPGKVRRREWKLKNYRPGEGAADKPLFGEEESG